MTKSDFDAPIEKLLQTKNEHLEVQTKLNTLITKSYNFFLDRMYVSSNAGSQNTFVYQPALDTLGLKKR